MTPKDAKNIGIHQTLKFITIAWLLFELVWLLQETKGDFGNGLLFYLDNHMHIEIAIIYCSIFGVIFFCGRQAGYDIIISGKKSFNTVVKYTTLSFAAIFLVLFIMFRLEGADIEQILPLMMVLFLIFLIVWILSIQQIKKRA